ncbi:MAG: type II toxin-antitoxin system RelE/ParE family toxin [Erysipelotrichaceae bacterium]|nr:type II toxin-antitoxin system RelE/ParE family toxin [Erysipelotrichaceae bacterium]
MKYQIKFSERFNKSFNKLDHYTQTMIYAWIEKHIEGTDNPRSTGKALTNNLKGLWRYRIGDYRLICEIHDKELIILAITIGHRRDIYK